MAVNPATDGKAEAIGIITQQRMARFNPGGMPGVIGVKGAGPFVLAAKIKSQMQRQGQIAGQRQALFQPEIVRRKRRIDIVAAAESLSGPVA